MKLKQLCAETNSLEVNPSISRRVTLLLCRTVGLFLILAMQGCGKGKNAPSVEENPSLTAIENSTPKQSGFVEVKTRAERGDADAQNLLGCCYYNGDSIDKDYAQAVNWWRKAAEQGEAAGQFNLGSSYSEG